MNKTARMKRASRGFSLLEVLVAFALLSLSLVVVFDIWNGSIRRASLNAQQARAMSIAESVLQDQLARRVAAPGNETGISSDGFAWRLERTVHPIPDPNVGFPWTQVRVGVVVEWTSVTGPVSVSSSTIMLAPL